MRRFLLLGIVLIAGLSRLTWAGPPFVTDDPEPVEYKHWEIDLASTYAHTAHDDFAQVPAPEIDYGIWPDVQLHEITPFAYDHADGQSHYGYSDTELGVKYRFIHETKYLPQVGVFPLVELPTGKTSEGLGNGKAQYFLPVWLQKSWGPWTSFGGGGLWRNPGRGNRNYWLVGWEIQRDFGEHLTLGGEIYHTTPAAYGEGDRTAFNFGGYLNFDEHRHILFSFGRDIQGPIHFQCYLAYQLTF
ncbi:MAG TPA: hypothetical protein VG722_04410 [Tepidisphaeraceae bacterium]|nr:hypothetical protein [Tepidisphaeraceae bacterium]